MCILSTTLLMQRSLKVFFISIDVCNIPIAEYLKLSSHQLQNVKHMLDASLLGIPFSGQNFKNLPVLW